MSPLVLLDRAPSSALSPVTGRAGVRSFFVGESAAFVEGLLTLNPASYDLGAGPAVREAVYAEGMHFCAQGCLALALWAFPEFDLSPGIALETLVPPGANPFRVLAALLDGLAPGEAPVTLPLGAWTDRLLRSVHDHTRDLNAETLDLSPWVLFVLAAVSIMSLGRKFSFEEDRGRSLQSQLRNLQDAFERVVTWRMTQDGADGWRVAGEPHALDQGLELLVALADRARRGEAAPRPALTQADVLMVAISGASGCAETSMLLASQVGG